MHQGLNQGCPDHWITIHHSQFLDHGILDVKRSWFAEQDYIILIFVFWVTKSIDLDLLGSYVWSIEFFAFLTYSFYIQPYYLPFWKKKKSLAILSVFFSSWNRLTVPNEKTTRQQDLIHLISSLSFLNMDDFCIFLTLLFPTYQLKDQAATPFQAALRPIINSLDD